MREHLREKARDNTLRLSSTYDANSNDITESQMPHSAAMAERRTTFCSGNGKRQPRTSQFGATKAALLLILGTVPIAMAQSCISLAGSTECPAFKSASVSTTDSTVVGYFPFLQFVSSTATFDEQLRSYISTSYAQEKYQQLLGCTNVDLTNTTNLYARFTTSVLCNAIVQNSRTPCGLSAANSQPICAASCADNAESEAIIVANSALCANPSSNAATQIRADFTNCALPANSLSGTCIDGAANEPNNCGFGNSTLGLCQYCGSGGQNSTDTCCYNSQAESRCANVVLPKITSLITISTSVPTAASSTSSPTAPASASGSSTAVPAAKKDGLSGGAIAGIAIGAIAGALALGALIILLILCLRKRRRGSAKGSVFNQPSPARKGPSVAYNPVAATTTPEGYEVLPGGRIARMSALESHAESPSQDVRGGNTMSAASGAAAGYVAGRGRRQESSSDEYSPISNVHGAGVLRPPPTARRNGSLSSNSALGFDDPQSPHSGSGGDLSSPPGAGASQQSEQLPFFKDYYSTDEIHPGDKVATLWAYQPRAGDEFALERGDMLKVVGIWDDGWATGVMIDENAEDWEAKKNAQRDSGVSHTTGSSPNVSGEIKAFPLVCVCLPDHWRKTIEGDGSTETGSTIPHGFAT